MFSCVKLHLWNKRKYPDKDFPWNSVKRKAISVVGTRIKFANIFENRSPGSHTNSAPSREQATQLASISLWKKYTFSCSVFFQIKHFFANTPVSVCSSHSTSYFTLPLWNKTRHSYQHGFLQYYIGRILWLPSYFVRNSTLSHLIYPILSVWFSRLKKRCLETENSAYKQIKHSTNCILNIQFCTCKVFWLWQYTFLSTKNNSTPKNWRESSRKMVSNCVKSRKNSWKSTNGFMVIRVTMDLFVLCFLLVVGLCRANMSL
jgi:hypothetical protein